MANLVHLIVHSGEHGLQEAADYYADFPWEPSPAGELNLAKAVTIKDANLESVLEEMAKVPSGGVVMIVCHAYSQGLLLGLAKDVRLNAGQEAIGRLLEVSEAERGAKAIRAMPAGTDPQQKAKIAAWEKLIESLAAGSVVGETTLKEVEGFYEKWLEEFARTQLLIPAPSARTVRRLVEKMEKVQALGLDRVELRACDIGSFEDGMKAVKKLFGCNRLLAPTVGTFFLKGVPVKTLDDFGALFVKEHPVRGRRPGPAGRTAPDPFDAYRANPNARMFWEYEYIPPANPHPAPNKYDGGTSRMWHIVMMIVEEIRPYWYRGSAGTWDSEGAHKPKWKEAQTFVRNYMMPRGKYVSGPLRVSGFWTPGETDAWLLPNEPAYLEHIKQI
jgi:hypothetical protein